VDSPDDPLAAVANCTDPAVWVQLGGEMLSDTVADHLWVGRRH